MYILVYMYTYSRVTSICIDLSKIKLFVFVFVFVFTRFYSNQRSRTEKNPTFKTVRRFSIF